MYIPMDIYDALLIVEEQTGREVQPAEYLAALQLLNDAGVPLPRHYQRLTRAYQRENLLCSS